MNSFSINIKFHDSLNDFLPTRKRNKFCPVTASGHQTIKDIIESLGIPHVEVDVILVNKSSVNFNFKIKVNDQVEVYGSIHDVKPKTLLHLQINPLKHPRFMLDEHLGKLARKLRMCGIDTQLFKGKSDTELVDYALHERRIILTRDVELLKRSIIKRGYWVRNENPDRQLKEIFKHFNLISHVKPFHRCMQCNGLIKKISKKNILDQIPPGIRLWFDEYFRCQSCGKIYWQGSHYKKMKSKIRSLL